MKIKELMKEVYHMSVEKGQWGLIDDVNHLVTKCTSDLVTELRANIYAGFLTSIHSEISEAYEALRDGKYDIWYDENNGNKPEGFVVELADAVIRICNICQLIDVDLEKAIKVKIAYNKLRPHKHDKKFMG